MKIQIRDISVGVKGVMPDIEQSYIAIKSNSDAALIKPLELALIPTGLILMVPNGYSLHLKCPKSLSITKKLMIVDSFDLENREQETELLIPILNLSGQNQVIMRGEIIANMSVGAIEPIKLLSN